MNILFHFSDSDDSDVGTALEAESYLMDEGGLVEGALLELNHEHQFGVKVFRIIALVVKGWVWRKD